MSDFYTQLETKKFLFIVFQKKQNSEEIVFKKFKFWNFPMKDIKKVEEVWDETKKLVEKGKIVKNIKVQKNGKKIRNTYFPGKLFNGIAHVRPHSTKHAKPDELPIPDKLTKNSAYTKHCFWLNAKYIQKQLDR
jgi:DNA mismatch repair protein MutH